ncbi:TPA-induced transmembrane protein homolog [Mugil cephalus]|uniref:TPA-induced transmembrane protein homolog n=1 Tax=Mugil cephalus TaxID=48193 RepID=UPI001FB70BFB|nr:TPA-induced transmembrane protein homolog [Mugil cephalus]
MADEEQIPAADSPDGGTTTEQPTAVISDSVDNKSPDATERDVLLFVEIANSNGETHPSHHSAQGQSSLENNSTPHEESAVSRVKRELNERVFMKVRLWMILVMIVVLIIVVIIISVAACSANHTDVDDKYDPSLFVVPQGFSGNFKLPKQNFTTELLDINSTQSRALATELQNELADLYRSSAALGRYFNTFEIKAFRNDPVTADYSLTFLLPKEQLDELRNFTLSREMVYNVFRQFLYDQEPAESGPLYVDPVSLQMIS